MPHPVGHPFMFSKYIVIFCDNVTSLEKCDKLSPELTRHM
jgi:hypothetical protein